jgi:hypothetical protein
MILTITIGLGNSMSVESPDTVKKIAEQKIRKLIEDDPVLGLFVENYLVEVHP